MLLLHLLSRLPLRALYLLTPAAYLAIYCMKGYRKTVVRENLARAFPERNGKELTVLEKKYYRQLIDVFVEILRARYMPAAEFSRRVQVANPQLLAAASDNFSRPLLVLTSHQGNWEWMLHGAGLAAGHSLDPVYKPLHQRWADVFMREVRGRFGSRPVALGDIGSDMLRRRRAPRPLVMVADQAPVPAERSYTTTFFGRRTSFHRAPAALAKLAQMPVLYAACKRRRRGHYTITFEMLAADPATIGEDELVERYARAAERAILAEPESWLWSNRRWKRETPDT